MAWLLLWAAAQAETATVRHAGDGLDAYAFDAAAAEALAAEGDRVAARTEEVFGFEVPRFALVLWRENRIFVHPEAGAEYRRHGAEWTIFWSDSYPDSGEWFRHELGHLVFGIPAERGCTAAVRRRTGGYGSVLPDWLDEASAVIQEEEYGSWTGEVFFDALAEDRTIPLAEFFSMTHPGHAAREEGRSRATEPVWLYYGQARVFVEFVGQEYGAEFVREVLRQAQRGRDFEDALPWLRRHSPEGREAPATLADLEARWLEWARTQR